MKKKFEDYIIGYKGSYTRKITQRDNDLFAELSGDYNPLHSQDDVAKEVGFKKRVSNGLVTESRLAAALVQTFGLGDCIVLELEKNTLFRRPVYIGDNITATVKVIERMNSMRILKIKAECFNQNDEKVIETSMLIQVLSRKGKI